MLKRILVLDDHQDVLDVIQEVLTYEQYEVLITSDDTNIISTIQTFMPDLLLMDYKLTGSNGGEICKQIRANPAFLHLPVIICSAYIGSGFNASFLGCDAVIAKPFGLDELLDTVNGLLV